MEVCEAKPSRPSSPYVLGHLTCMKPIETLYEMHISVENLREDERPGSGPPGPSVRRPSRNCTRFRYVNEPFY